jgi:hypothetical protein
MQILTFIEVNSLAKLGIGGVSAQQSNDEFTTRDQFQNSSKLSIKRALFKRALLIYQHK